MKRNLLCLLLLVSLLCTGCARQEENPGQESGGLVDPLLESYLSEADMPQPPTREYGESVSLIRMEENFVARILYPAGELKALDAAVEAWVQETAAYYEAESAGSNANGDSAELTVDYSSCVIEEELVAVKLSGVYERPYMAHPVDVSDCFNARKTTGELLTLTDILLPGGETALRNKVVELAGIDAELVDKHLLDHWLLTHEGLEITLVRGDYLPMSDGTVTLVFPYEDLEGIYAGIQPSREQAEKPEEQEDTPLPEGNVPEQGLGIDPTKPMLALTFDDGPSAHTERLLDIFAEHGGKGTFYVVGNMLDGRPNALRRMAAEGHEIGGHSWNHRQLTKLSEEELTEQLMSTRAKIYEIAGVDAVTVRPPYGSCNDQVKETAGELGISLINWSVDTLDWKNKNADAVYKAVLEGAKDGAIILCHDLHKTTVDAMERVIPALIEEGYQLVTVSELLTSNGESMVAGKVYFKR